MSAVALMFTMGLVFAGYFDVTRRRVPNWLNITILLVGVGVSVFSRDIVDILTGVGTAFFVILPFFHFRVYRGGDAKLLIACGAWFSYLDWLIGFAIGMFLGALHALLILMTDPADRKRAGQTLWLLYVSRLGTLGEERDVGSRTGPMAVSFGVGMALAFHTDLIAMVGA